MPRQTPEDIAKIISEDVNMPQHMVEAGLFDEPEGPEGPPDMGGEPEPEGPDMGMEPDMGPEEQAAAEPITLDRELLVMLLTYAKTGERPISDEPDMGMGGDEGGVEMSIAMDAVVREMADSINEYGDEMPGSDEMPTDEPEGDAGMDMGMDMGGDDEDDMGGSEGCDVEALADAVAAHAQIEGEPGIPGEASEGAIMTAEDFDEILSDMEAGGVEDEFGGDEFGGGGEEEGGSPFGGDEGGAEECGTYESRRRFQKV